MKGEVEEGTPTSLLINDGERISSITSMKYRIIVQKGIYSTC